METQQRKPVDWALVTMFAAGLLLGGGAATWAVLKMHKPQAQAQAQVPVAKPATAPTPAHVTHVACPSDAVIAAAGRDDGLMRLKREPDTPAEIAALILAGKESAAAGRPRDAELIFLAACKAADRMQRADATEPTDARYQLARHYAHHVQIGNVPAAARAELLRRADLLYADSVQAYRSRYGAEHEKTRFASEGLAALRQVQPQPVTQAAAAPAAVAPKAVAVKAAAVPIEARPVAPPPEPRVAETPRPRRVARPAEPQPDTDTEVTEAPVRQATGNAQ